eukprot:UN02184
MFDQHTAATVERKYHTRFKREYEKLNSNIEGTDINTCINDLKVKTTANHLEIQITSASSSRSSPNPQPSNGPNYVQQNFVQVPQNTQQQTQPKTNNQVQANQQNFSPQLPQFGIKGIHDR